MRKSKSVFPTKKEAGIQLTYEHTSVLLDECVNGLSIKPNGIYVDATTGGGGHSLQIAERLDHRGRLICIDQDGDALRKASEVLAKYRDRVTFVRDNFANIKDVLAQLGYESVDGILADLGVSSYQLTNAERGFSYMQDGPLDMRMDDRSGLTAHEVVNRYKEDKLSSLIFQYGEERYARRIAAGIVRGRQKKPINTTFELTEIIKAAAPTRPGGPHPAKRTFQAIRIEVNGELEILEAAVNDMLLLLAAYGRVCVITFHSLEDRIVKNCLKTAERPCTCPADFPVCVCGKQPYLKVITKKPVVPGADELERNHRARSAKLRIGERMGI